MSSSPLVSIVIPAYNARNHIGRALRSCAMQTYLDIEVLVIDDGSTDDTVDVVREFETEIAKLEVISIPNGGQGAARNLATNRVRGEYLFFLDADDELLPNCIDILMQEMRSFQADVVLCDWRIYDDEGCYLGVGSYVEHLRRGMLSDEQRLWFLGRVAFCTKKLCRVDWLRAHSVQCAEGHLYEDAIFHASVCLEPGRICYLPRPLYTMYTTATSSTRLGYSTDRHAIGFVNGIRETVTRYGTRIAAAPSYYLNYCLGRAYLYSAIQHRIPMRLWRQFAIDMLRELRSLANPSLRISRYKKWALLHAQRHPTLAALSFYSGMRLERIGFVKRQWKRVKKMHRSRATRQYKTRRGALLRKCWREPIESRLILCYDLNGAVRGNTLAMLHALRNTSFTVIVTAEQPDHWEPADNVRFVKRASDEYLHAYARAGIHLLENWQPVVHRKRPGTRWVQMWHGTPMKKMLYESDLPALMARYKKHKRRRGEDVAQWDYVLSQNDFSTEKLALAFALPTRCMVELGYPRTDIFFSAERDAIRARIRSKYGADKPILLYAPTWRDYNRFMHLSDTNFLLDLPKSGLSENYTTLALPHPLFSASAQPGNWQLADDDTQELLIAADVLVTDYSSILFDWLLLGKPFALLWKDLPVYNFVRGIYSEIERDFYSFIARDERGLAEVLQNFAGYDRIGNRVRYINATDHAGEDVLRLLERLSEEIEVTQSRLS